MVVESLKTMAGEALLSVVVIHTEFISAEKAY